MKSSHGFEEKFFEIKRLYNDYYDSLLKKGKLNCRDTKIGFWGCASPDAVFEFFSEIRLDRFKNFIDLGSGDGVVAVIAGLFTSSTGVEFDRDLYLKSVQFRDSLGMDIELVNRDFMNMDLSSYDIAFINPDKDFSRFESRLLKELSCPLIVYNNIFVPHLMERGAVFWHEQMPITVWYPYKCRQELMEKFK